MKATIDLNNISYRNKSRFNFQNNRCVICPLITSSSKTCDKSDLIWDKKTFTIYTRLAIIFRKKILKKNTSICIYLQFYLRPTSIRFTFYSVMLIITSIMASDNAENAAENKIIRVEIFNDYFLR